MKYVTAGMNPMDLKRGIDKAVVAAVEELKKVNQPCSHRKEIAQVASSPPTATTIGNTIADAMDRVGKEGVITVGTARASRTSWGGGRGACSSTAATSRRTS